MVYMTWYSNSIYTDTESVLFFLFMQDTTDVIAHIKGQPIHCISSPFHLFYLLCSCDCPFLSYAWFFPPFCWITPTSTQVSCHITHLKTNPLSIPHELWLLPHFFAPVSSKPPLKIVCSPCFLSSHSPRTGFRQAFNATIALKALSLKSPVMSMFTNPMVSS